MKKNSRNWRINVVIDYSDLSVVSANRHVIISLLSNIACLYKLDFSIVYDPQGASVSDSVKQETHKFLFDMIYFRSNKYSRIESKGFRRAFQAVFDYVPAMGYEGVEAFLQLSKVLPEYPFPKQFYRPLAYPFVEVHKDGHMTLCISAEALSKEIQTAQVFSQN
jgi:hypothetical protein